MKVPSIMKGERESNQITQGNEHMKTNVKWFHLVLQCTSEVQRLPAEI